MGDRKKAIKEPTTIACTNCGKIRILKPSQRDKIVSRGKGYQCKTCFCANPPKGKNGPRWNGGPVTLTCVDCGKKIVKFRNVAERSKSPFKCVVCYGKSIVGEKRTNWRDENPLVECSICGQKKNVGKYQARIYREREEKYKCFNCSIATRPEGESSPAWRGGLNSLPYAPGWTNRLKEKVRRRDGLQCQICGEQQRKDGKLLPVHHIDYNKENCHDINLITLCQICHSKTNYNRGYWQAYFTRQLQQAEQTNNNC